VRGSTKHWRKAAREEWAEAKRLAREQRRQAKRLSVTGPNRVR
jgi:hypothetical protein